MGIRGRRHRKAAAAGCRNRLLISPSKRSVVGGVEEMVKQKLVTLIVPSLVLDEFRRLRWIYPSRLHMSNPEREPGRLRVHISINSFPWCLSAMPIRLG